MKKLVAFIFSLSFAFVAFAQTQDDPVIFEINGKKIFKSEFMKEFLRSVGKDPKAAPTACTYEKRQALTEYVDLFVNFRTKLEDAYMRGFDTNVTLVKELKGYRDELAAPYLIDSASMLRILQEAYDRNHYTMHAAHILVKVKKNATPDDTLKAYKKAMEYYNRVMSGEDFLLVATEANEERAKQEGFAPDDPRRRADNGDLGNFTVFDMVYPFENAVYSLQPGEVSKPVRSQYGYHVVKLLDKTPFFGKCTFQHIWCAANTNPAYAEVRCREAYGQLMEGASFTTVCRNYSDDNGTVNNGGLLTDMSIRQLPPEYIVVLSGLKPGEISQPFQTSYGWHILLLNNRDSIPAFEDMVPNYKQRLTRDPRNKEPRKSFIEQCKKRYNFIDYTQMYLKPSKKGKKQERVYLASLDECVAAFTPEVWNLQWVYADSMITDLRPLFVVGEKEYTAVDFLKYVEAHQHAERPQDMRMFTERRYDEFIDEMVFAYADSQLEIENPEFGELIQEYRNGLMIFAYNDEMIWSKSFRDTLGLQAFYRVASQTHSIDNEEDAPYFWNERALITLVTVDDSASIAPEKMIKLLEKCDKKGWDSIQFYNKVAAAVKNGGTFRIEEQIVERDHQTLLKPSWWRKGIYCNPQPKGYQIVKVVKTIDPCLKSVKEARGYYINDYQNELDKQLIEQLRKQYHVVIHQDVIDDITY